MRIRQRYGVWFALEADPSGIAWDIETAEKGVQGYVLSYEDEATMTSPEDGVEQCIERLQPQVVKKPPEAV